MIHRSRRFTFAVIGLSAALGLGSCGSKSSDSTPDAQTKNAAVATPMVALVNADFTAGRGGWVGSGYTLAEGCMKPGAPANTFPSMGAWLPNALAFGTTQRTVSQSVVVPNPSKVTFSFQGQVRGDMTNGSFTATLSDADESQSTGAQTGAPLVTPKNFSLSVTTKSSNETVKVNLTGGTPTNWSGCYGPVITQAQLFTASDVSNAIAAATTLVPPVTTVVVPPPVTVAPTTVPPTTVPKSTTTAPVSVPATTVATITSTTLPPTTVSNLSCKAGGRCVLGDIGPGGGYVIYANESLPAGSRYIEVSPSDYDNPQYGYKRFDSRYLDTEMRYGDALGAVRKANLDRLGGKSDWRVPSKTDANFLCLYARQITTSNDCGTKSPGLRGGFYSWYWTADASNPSIGKAWCLSLYADFNIGNGQTMAPTPFLECNYVDLNHLRFVRTF